MAIQVLDDLSDNEKNLQMLDVSTLDELIGKPDMVRQFDSEKIERLERCWSKSSSFKF